MDLKHSFTVPASIDETWAAFQDIESVAECFPGAQIISVEGDTFNGTVKVKLGPIALVYKGTGTFTERDESTHKMVIDAKGKDKRGNGTAGALVTATMAEVDGGTTVDVVTDLAITGKPAQFGRGVIQDVSDKLLGQFVDCLQAKVGSSTASAEAADRASAESAESASVAAPVASSVASSTTPSPEPAARPTPATPLASAPARSEDDSLDLGAAVLPVLAKAYWKQAVAAVAGLAIFAGLIKRLRR
ncbi:SRPBCC family protein [Flexivirga alba]|uniref:SRPBCC family protein n=1 Tax=Flexivirga alba TaxID=702742 RepID=A0ABW2AJ28_9MICO